MLSNLLIKNYALIRHLEMQPSPGLNIITGETGAGKSIMLGAVGLLMGNRADTKMLLNQEHKCVVEGTFNIQAYSLQPLFKEYDWEYYPETIIRREINTSGKSRAFINDSPVTLDALSSLGMHLLDVHSQNDSQKLGGQHFQRHILDLYGQHQLLVDQYQEHYRRWSKLKQQHQKLLTESQQQQKEADYKNFLLQELNAAALKADEQQELEESLKVVEHAEEIKINLQGSLQLLQENEQSAVEQLAETIRMLGRIQSYAEFYSSLKERLDSTLIEIRDIVAEIETLDQQIEHNPAQIEQLQSRLDAIYRLQKKHGVNSVQELLHIQQDLIKEASRLQNLDETLSQLEQEIKTAEKEMIASGEELFLRRQQTFPIFKQRMEDLLGHLGMAESKLECKFEKAEPGPHGLEKIEWLFSANKGVAPQSLKKVASGGEFSRLMFCVKYLIADKVSLPTIIFDEIDTGISGEVALQMIDMMDEMSQNHQVIAISHLPQFAAKGHHHYYVYKESDQATTSSGIRKLDGTERVEAVAKMLGGNNPSEVAIANAKELLGTRDNRLLD